MPQAGLSSASFSHARADSAFHSDGEGAEAAAEAEAVTEQMAPLDVDAIFEAIDHDAMGSITIDSVQETLQFVLHGTRRDALVCKLDEERRAAQKRRRSLMMPEAEVQSPIVQLKESLDAHASRVIDLFRKWDIDGDGTVDKKEFRAGLEHLGFGTLASHAEVSDTATLAVTATATLGYSRHFTPAAPLRDVTMPLSR